MLACQSSDSNLEIANKLLKSNIYLPIDSMEVFLHENYPESKNKNDKVILYLDSTRCSSCELRTLTEWQSFVQLLRQEEGIELDIIWILSPSKKDYDTLKSSLKTIKPSFPVYIDIDNNFIRKNPQIPSDHLYHTLIINNDNHVILIGNIMKNKRLLNLFLSEKNKKCS